MVTAICTELETHTSKWSSHDIHTVYFGGGTPSHIPVTRMERITETIRSLYPIADNAEFTLECNPEDLDQAHLSAYRKMGFNRLSIGIQSFSDVVLQRMNRAHDAAQAQRVVRLAQDMGFDNISVDLIYGHRLDPDMGLEAELDRFMSLDVQHVSAYALSIEENTYFHHLEQKKGYVLSEDDLAAAHFLTIRSALEAHGIYQYEVSNYAKKGYESKHNSSYWSGVPYLGIGPSAHSYDGRERSWNIANNHGYMSALEEGASISTTEVLDEVSRYNEYILTRVRTVEGLDLDYVRSEFGVDILQEHSEVLGSYDEAYTILGGKLRLLGNGLLLADRFAADLFKDQ